MSDSNHDLWGYIKESVLRACDDVCGYEKNRKCNVSTWWWNSGVKMKFKSKKKYIKKLKNSH